MYDMVNELVTRLSDVVSTLDSATVTGEDAYKLVAVFSRAEKLVAAGRTLATKRVLETQAWYGHGFRNPAQWIAANTGGSVSSAAGVVETARALDDLPAVRSALVSGQVSSPQAAEIVVAAKADPSSETSLLDAVERGDTFKQLKDKCQSIVASALGDEDAHERARRGRYLNHRLDGVNVLVEARLAPADAAPMIAYVDKRGMELWEKARRSKHPLSKGAARADALTEMFSEGARTSVVVNVHCDASAFERGRTVAGERCEIQGVGPVPVSTVRILANNGTVKTLGHNDHDITHVRHHRKDIPAKLRSAILARDPQCVVPGCDETEGLEIDHIVPRAEGGETSYRNLAPLCRYDHYLKTHHGYTLSGKPGAWEFKPPPPGWKPKRRFNRNE